VENSKHVCGPISCQKNQVDKEETFSRFLGATPQNQNKILNAQQFGAKLVQAQLNSRNSLIESECTAVSAAIRSVCPRKGALSLASMGWLRSVASIK